MPRNTLIKTGTQAARIIGIEPDNPIAAITLEIKYIRKPANTPNNNHIVTFPLRAIRRENAAPINTIALKKNG